MIVNVYLNGKIMSDTHFDVIKTEMLPNGFYRVKKTLPSNEIKTIYYKIELIKKIEEDTK